MPIPVIFAVVAISMVLSSWAAQRDLQVPAYLTIAAFASAAAIAYAAFDVSFTPIAALTIACLLIAEVDRRHQLIPDLLTLAVFTLAFVMPFGDDAATRVIGAVALGATFLIIRQTCSVLRGVEALGLGDVKFAAAMGAVLGPIFGFVAVAVAGVATLLVVTARARGGAIAAGAPFGIGLATATATVAILRVVLP